jgi:HK97 family phage portal protein
MGARACIILRDEAGFLFGGERMKNPFRRAKAQARDKPGVRTTLSLRMLNRPRADATIQGNEAIYAAVSRISNTIAAMPIHYYKGYEIQRDHPMERLINLEPHPNFTAFGWRQTMEVMRNTEGNAYALKILDNFGQTVRLDILNPLKVTPQVDPEDGSIWYAITMDDGKQALAPGFLVINLRHMSANGIKGIRPIDVLRKSLDYDTQVKAMSLDQLDGVNHGVALTIPSVGLSQEQKDEAVDRFLETYEKSGRSVVILEGGMTATNFSSSPVDAQLLDVERITRNRVATVYNLPPHLLGDYSDTSFGTAEQQMMEYLQLTITPIVEQWEEELNRKLITPEDYAAGYRFRFDVNTLTRTDVKTTAERNQMAIRGGWRKPNEVRAELGLPPDPVGDLLMSSRDLIPLRIAVEHPEQLLGSQAAPAEPAGESEGKEDKEP